VARDRKRAKQRRDRRARDGAQAPSTGVPVRADVPGALGHASSEVDEFDAALIAGAGGVTASPEASPPEGREAEAEGELAVQQAPSDGGAGGGGAEGGGGGGGGGEGDHERPAGAPLRGGSRAMAFLRASWAELQRVQWPDRRQTAQATAVVLGFVAVAGLYLGFADYVAKEVVEILL